MSISGEAFQAAGIDGLRWVAAQRLPARTGAWWPATASPADLPQDNLYAGTAGVLHALTAARVAGIEDFDAAAAEAAARLAVVVGEPVQSAGLYTGTGGHACALAGWGKVTGDLAAADTAFHALAAAWKPASGWGQGNDIIFGDAGSLVALLSGGAHEQVVRDAAHRLAGLGRDADGGPDWNVTEQYEMTMPGFSHGTAGVGYAIGRVAEAFDDEQLLAIASAAGRRMVTLGDRGDGTWLAPHSIPQSPHAAPHSLGWCHGPTGSLRLFALLQRLQPSEGWDHWVDAARRTVRESGVPERKEPGFWDNIGQCCGTAGVGEMALDAFAESKDEGWLTWARELGEDVLSHAITDEAGTRWSNVEHTASPSELPPEVGWSQGAAGISVFLIRLGQTLEQGPGVASCSLADAG